MQVQIKIQATLTNCVYYERQTVYKVECLEAKYKYS